MSCKFDETISFEKFWIEKHGEKREQKYGICYSTKTAGLMEK